MDIQAKEEFIWAMRCHRQEDISQSTKNVLAEEIMKTTSEEVYSEYHTKVLASLVPDEIIYNVKDYSKRSYDVCLLFGDVSGFTDLCDQYNKVGQGGPSRLTSVLNGYIGSMVQEIMGYNGDVLKFSGDAFLAMWKCTDSVFMQDTVHDALDCALIIQKTYAQYKTDVGIMLRGYIQLKIFVIHQVIVH